MSHYHYTNEVGDGLHVQQVTSGEFLVRVSHNTGKAAGIGVPHEEATALALAILEAAGVGNASSRHMAAAWRNLNRHITERKADAEREAEDAKVRNFRTHQWKAQDENRAEVMPLWDNLSNYERDLWRTEYRAARKFFGEEQ